MKKVIIYHFVLILMFGCRDKVPDMPEIPEVDGKVHIRIKNNSKYVFQESKFHGGFTTLNYGPINKQSHSDFLPCDSSYRFGYVEVKINDVYFDLRPVSYEGEETIDPGLYTMEVTVLNFIERRLSQKMIKED